MFLEGDGAMLVAGNLAGGQGAAMLRLRPDGSPDAGFGTGGLLLIDPDASPAAASAFRQADGKYLLLARAQGGTLTVARALGGIGARSDHVHRDGFEAEP